METTPGVQTSEFKVTMLVMLFGAILDGAGLVLETLQNSGASHSPWISTVLVVLGTVMALLSALGYKRGRVLLKLAALQDGATEALKAATPFVRDSIAAVKELRAPQTLQPEPSVVVSPPSTP